MIDAAARRDLEPMPLRGAARRPLAERRAVCRVPDADDPALGGDEFANNHFLFEDDTRPSVLQPIPGYGGDRYAAARADVLGAVCPHSAHIRKVNPRDAGPTWARPPTRCCG